MNIITEITEAVMPYGVTHSGYDCDEEGEHTFLSRSLYTRWRITESRINPGQVVVDRIYDDGHDWSRTLVDAKNKRDLPVLIESLITDIIAHKD